MVGIPVRTKVPKPKLNRQILEEASEWFVDFRVGDVDAEASERFDQWLRRSPEHIRAYMEIAKTYVELPTEGPDRKINVQELIARARSADPANVISLDRSASTRVSRARGVADGIAGASTSSLPNRNRYSVRALAASIVLALVVGGLFVRYVRTRDPVYTTEIGERRSITLTDGSTIDLNSRSRIRVHFSKAERDVELIDGQALFEVAKNKARPFIVKGGTTWVRAVGTQFQVDRRSSLITVTVVEGRVMVLPAGGDGDGAGPLPLSIPLRALDTRVSGDGKSAELTALSAGEEVTVADGVIARPKRANIAEATAWMQHRLIFDASRLIDVVDEFNRYNARQLVIEDRGLDDFHMSGVYTSTDPASLIRFLKEQPGVQVTESDQVVRITRQ
jgi:transmembrane sensor